MDVSSSRVWTSERPRTRRAISRPGCGPKELLLGGSALPGTVLACERHGRDACLTVETQAGLLSVLADWEQGRSDPGTAVHLDIGPGAVVLFSAADGKRIEWDAHQGGAHAR